jgi:glycosyltransferase involved in cell wall biosynthesis
MTSTTLGRNGHGTALREQAEAPVHEGDNGFLQVSTARLRAAKRLAAAEAARAARQEDAPADERPALAVFCYAEPDSLIGRHTGQTVAALARRHISVHLFSRFDFTLGVAGVTDYTVGECSGDLLDSVQEFASRSCNAFLERFPAGCPHVTLFGAEWSSWAALSLLRGLKNLPGILSLHSLERQRSDMSGILSKRIEEIELAGLREARAILVHEPAAAEVAKYWVPECEGRITHARPRFPVHQFQRDLDPGTVKARYQVGPVDPTILYVGDLDERYGPDVLLKSMPAVLKNHPQARLVIVGDGPLYWPLRVYARYLLLEPAVRLAGSVEGQDLQELIQAADILAVPSREATPWWPIQAAWAAQHPVVATHAAAPGLVEHEQDAVLFYPSENSCVWGIERVLFDPELGRTLARQGHAKLEERFGWNTLAEQVEGLMGVPQTR